MALSLGTRRRLRAITFLAPLLLLFLGLTHPVVRRHQSASEGASFLADFFLAVAFGFGLSALRLVLILSRESHLGTDGLTVPKLALSRP